MQIMSNLLESMLPKLLHNVHILVESMLKSPFHLQWPIRVTHAQL